MLGGLVLFTGKSRKLFEPLFDCHVLNSQMSKDIYTNIEVIENITEKALKITASEKYEYILKLFLKEQSYNSYSIRR